MATARLTTKGQITLPKPIRDHLGLREGDRIDFFVRPDGVVELRPLNVDLRQWFGHIQPEVAVSVPEMDPGAPE